jgi:CRISPR-associated protein Cmr1
MFCRKGAGSVELEAIYRVTTPLFLGGAQPEQVAELRPPSLKGLLRFWLRAVAWPRLGNWEAMAAAEKSLLGSTEGQSAWLLSARWEDPPKSIGAPDPWERQEGLGYLGYGVVDRQRTLRPYVKEDSRFRLRLVRRPLRNRAVAEVQEELLIQAAMALGLFGGAGARSRKGFGSLTLESLRCNGEEKWQRPRNERELAERLRDWLARLGEPRTDGLPPYTAFGSQTKVWILGQGPEARRLLNWLGMELLRYRSYGYAPDNRGPHVLPGREPAEQNFADDHDLILHFLTGQRVSRHPRRAVFGLPHNYFFRSTRQKATVEPADATYGGQVKRRASPLFLHIHALASGGCAAVAALLPAAFLPEGECLRLSTGRHSVTVPCAADYRDLEEFFHRPAFARKVAVWP